MLTGCTGFLGIHILEELINSDNGNIYCIVRNNDKLTAKERFINKFHYYFETKYDELIDNRIHIIDGDVTKEAFGLNNEEQIRIANAVDIVINSAAIVAHYGNYERFYNANVKSVRYIIDYCKKFNKKFYHISTRSVAGQELDKSYLVYKAKKTHKIKFKESSLYIGQILDGVYSRSKFEAESYILNAINSGLDGYIFRMGNLMPRYRDGIFQENVSDNNFINKLVSFVRIGFIPDYMLDYKIEFTPVDYAAKAIIKLINHSNSKNRIFHLFNQKVISTKKILKFFNKMGYNVRVISEEKFKKQIEKILNDDKKIEMLKYIIDDFDSNQHLKYKSDITVVSAFSIKYLKKTNFRWPKINKKYLTKFINLLKGLK